MYGGPHIEAAMRALVAGLIIAAWAALILVWLLMAWRVIRWFQRHRAPRARQVLSMAQKVKSADAFGERHSTSRLVRILGVTGVCFFLSVAFPPWVQVRESVQVRAPDFRPHVDRTVERFWGFHFLLTAEQNWWNAHGRHVGNALGAPSRGPPRVPPSPNKVRVVLRVSWAGLYAEWLILTLSCALALATVPWQSGTSTRGRAKR